MLGHRRDPVHPFSDAGMLAEEMPNARLIEANSLVELRLQPERLTDEIAAFLDELWAAAEQTRRTPRESRRSAAHPAQPAAARQTARIALAALGHLGGNTSTSPTSRGRARWGSDGGRGALADPQHDERKPPSACAA